MGSITFPELFGAQQEKRPRQIDHSLDREPWRAFRPSLAVRFTSRKRGGWCAESLSDEARAEIVAGLEARSVIISTYSAIQSTMRDFAAKAGFSRADGSPRGTYSAPTQDVLSFVKRLASSDARLRVHREALELLVDRFAAAAEEASLAVRGFVEVREEKSGSMAFRFNHGPTSRSFSSEELENRAAELELLSVRAKSRLGMAGALL